MPITVKLDVSKAVEAARTLKRQVPFILAKTLTDTAKQAQAATKTSLTTKSAFTLRNTWTESSIRAKPASKDSPNGRIEADVHTDFSRRSDATDYLALQEDNYVKMAAHAYLCIPTDALYALCGGRRSIIPDSLKPRALLNFSDKQFSYEVTKGRNKGTRRSAGKGPSVRGWVFFNSYPVRGGREFLHTKSGARGIWGRRANDQKAFLMYVMVRQTKSTRGRFHMEQVVRETAESSWQANWDKNWADMFARGIRF